MQYVTATVLLSQPTRREGCFPFCCLHVLSKTPAEAKHPLCKAGQVWGEKLYFSKMFGQLIIGRNGNGMGRNEKDRIDRNRNRKGNNNW